MKKITDTDATEATVTERPTCDLMHAAPVPAEYDAKTTMGPWAYLCVEHFRTYGVGLGMGRGQRLIVRDEP